MHAEQERTDAMLKQANLMVSAMANGEELQVLHSYTTRVLMLSKHRAFTFASANCTPA
jgi:hypothetical protein